MALQFQAPFNYQPDLRSTSDRVNQLGDTLNKIGNQALERRATMAQIAALYQQRQAEGVKSLASLYAAGGPDAVGQLGGNLAGSMGIDLKGLNYQSPPMSQPSSGGTGNDQSQNFPQGSPSMNTPVGTNQNPQIYPTPIHASVLGHGNPLNTDHPDYAHLANPQNMNGGAPDFSGLSSDIGALANRMDQYQGHGSYGATQQVGIKNQIEAKKAMIDAQMAPLNYAQKEQELNLARTKPLAEEVSKQTQSADETRQLRSLYNGLKTALSKDKSSITGDISGKISQATSGRLGSPEDAEVLNAANPLATTLNTVLSRRFNSGEVQMLSNSLIPKPSDTPAYRQQKMQRLGKMIQTMEQGNEQNIRNVGSALMGNIPSLSQPMQPQASAQTGMVTIRDSQGGMHSLPADKLAAARQRDPGLSLVSQ